MALTAGQKTWLDEQVGTTRSETIIGSIVAVEKLPDNEDGDVVHRFIVENEQGRAAFESVNTPDADAQHGSESSVGVNGEVTSWKSDGEDDALLRIDSDAGYVWERVTPPRSQEELDAEAAAAAAAAEQARATRETVVARVNTARAKGANRTPAETAALLDDLAALVADEVVVDPDPTKPSDNRPTKAARK